jgi:hypothetical protein
LYIIQIAFKPRPTSECISKMVKIQTYDPKKKDSYIVLLHDHVDKKAHLNWLSNIPNTLAGITHDYDSKFLNGFTGAISSYIDL